MNRNTLLVLVVSIVAVLVGCQTKSKLDKVSARIYPPPLDPTNPALTTPIVFSIYGVVVAENHGELGLVIFQGNPASHQPGGFVLTCKGDFREGVPVIIEMSSLFVQETNASFGHSCLRVCLSALNTGSNPITNVEIIPFTARMFQPVIFRGVGEVVRSSKDIGVVAIQHASAERVDLLGVYIDAIPKLEKNDPVKCTMKQVQVSGDRLPGGRPHILFRVTIEKQPGSLVGERVAQNTKP